MTQLVDDTMMAEAVAAAGLSMDGAKPGPAPLASPSYKALESRSVFAEGAFVKRMHPEMMQGFDLEAAMALASQAAQVGAGPEVIWHDATIGAVAMTDLSSEWRTANQASLQDLAVVTAAMSALKTLHGTQALVRRFDPFAQIDELIKSLGREAGALPDDIVWLRRLIAQLEPMMEGGKLAPCRNDGSSSNLMIGPNGAVLLVDFDRAGMNDPLYDVGCLLAEITIHERDMQPGYLAYAGEFDKAGFARARLWSFVDDLLHALWSRLKSKTSQRGAIEWLKYGEWRLIRVRMALMHPQFEEKIRLSGLAS
ncbi:phosphotransferase [Marivita sp.]|jgi:thiamine kinase-like enzyme|uniref:phosphotransferase family protein n=1 Tax=Marivita sp. TaxID=2003365 RepID=UPI0026250313|nr:phosphotransferase [Marivita sp.]